ncbi:HNH endonuclease [Lactococcus lactis]|uniref:HNH endonuclease n=1 Tax=Lactococcus lactis TaxID=1358 RepID=UPI0021A286BD|nr:HNH endonuclease [Lactococcus lactis]MCT3091384.1 HNH endonuclease [Lactococcus lactis]
MQRVHGEYTIRRRTKCENHFSKYSDDICRTYLKEDFNDICGYCGKQMTLLKSKAQVDHFIPQKFAPDKKDDYSNLVYSCPKCNRGKWHHWPTECIEFSHNDSEGFVDPATDEYDLHLIRNDNGEILGITEVGKYMVEKMKLDIRPIAIIWKVELLNKKLTEISNIIEKYKKKGGKEELLDIYASYYEASQCLRKSLDDLYEQNESI